MAGPKDTKEMGAVSSEARDNMLDHMEKVLVTSPHLDTGESHHKQIKQVMAGTHPHIKPGHAAHHDLKALAGGARRSDL